MEVDLSIFECIALYPVFEKKGDGPEGNAGLSSFLRSHGVLGMWRRHCAKEPVCRLIDLSAVVTISAHIVALATV